MTPLLLWLWLCPILTIAKPPKTINYSRSCIVLQPCFWFRWTWELLKYRNASLYCFTAVVLDMVPGHRRQVNCTTDHLFKWSGAACTHRVNFNPLIRKRLYKRQNILYSHQLTNYNCTGHSLTVNVYSATRWQTRLWAFKVFLQFQLMPWPQLLC